MTAPYAQALTTQPVENDRIALTVTGNIPDWMRGTLVRNGPGQFEVGSTPIAHWFDGLAMLHAFTIDGSQVHYTNRFIRSNAYERDNANGKINYMGFAQDPCRAIFKKVMTLFTEVEAGNNAVVNVTRLGDEFVAMTEFPLTVRFDPRTLQTLGVLDYNDKLAAFTATAHPHYDPVRRAGINMMTEYGRKTAYQIYSLTDTARHKLGEVSASDISYIHSFALTPRYAIVVQFSLRLGNAAKMLLSGKPFIQNFTYAPSQDALFSVIDLESGRLVANVPADAFFAFHHINAYEEGDALVVDLAAYDNADLINQLYVAEMRQNQPIPMGEFRRYHVPLTGGRATCEVMSEEGLELPRINYQYNGLPYRYVYGSSTQRATPEFLNQLVRVDTHTRTSTVWHEANAYPSEPVFLPAPDAASEGDGVILSVVLDSLRGTSFLLVLDAMSFSEMARAQIPQHVPFGFHGQFFGGVL